MIRYRRRLLVLCAGKDGARGWHVVPVQYQTFAEQIAILDAARELFSLPDLIRFTANATRARCPYCGAGVGEATRGELRRHACDCTQEGTIR